MPLVYLESPYDLSLEWFPDHCAIANYIFSVCEAWNDSAFGNIESVYDTNNVVLACACTFNIFEQSVRKVFLDTGAKE